MKDHEDIFLDHHTASDAPPVPPLSGGCIVTAILTALAWAVILILLHC